MKKYSRRKTYRKRTRRPRRYRRYTLSKGQIIKLNKIHYPEVKFKVPVTLAATAFSNSGHYALLNGLDYGTTDNARIGDKVNSISLTGNIAFNNNSSSSFALVRFIIVRDKQANGSSGPTWSDIFTSGTNVMALRNLDTYKRYKIHTDKLITLTNQSKQSQTFRINLKFKHVVDYLESGSAATDIQKNALWFIAITDRVTDLPTLWYDFRFRYSDN